MLLPLAAETPSMPTDLQRAQTLFETEALPFPLLPPELAAALRERTPAIFSSHALEAPPYVLDVHLGDWLSGSAAFDHAVVAMDGHGTNSWAMHYYLVHGPLALFVQLPWGGAYVDEEAARAQIRRVLDWAAPLPARLAALQTAGRLDPGQKLLAVVSRFTRSGWAWVRTPVADPEALDWRPADKMLTQIDTELDTLGR